jgi:flagellar biosynthesis anti-sigma factor FlgM
MRIDLAPGAQLFPETDRNTRQVSVSTNAESSTSSPVDAYHRQLSGGYSEIRKLAALAAQLPDVGQEKVKALRKIVLGGSYEPSSEQVAEALFAHLLVKPAA